MADARVLIVGAGIGGLATAYHLVERGVPDVWILEREPRPANHSSARNAGILRQAVVDEVNQRLARRTRAFLTDGALGTTLLRDTGVLYLDDPEDPSTLDALEESLAARDLSSWPRTVHEAAGGISYLDGAPDRPGLFVPEDGVIIVPELNDRLLRAARKGGARLCLETPALAIRTEGGRAVGVETPDGTIRADAVVNAAGAWAGPLAARSGIEPPPLEPHRRHVVLFEVGEGLVNPHWPVVWNLAAGWYVRPEGEHLLASPCDEEPVPVRDEPGHAPGDAFPPFDGRWVRTLHERLAAHVPRISELDVRASWACVRTLTPDGRFVLGPDPRVEDLHWVAGLGGHGMSGGPEAGRLVAAAIDGESPGGLDPMLPSRFSS